MFQFFSLLKFYFFFRREVFEQLTTSNLNKVGDYWQIVPDFPEKSDREYYELDLTVTATPMIDFYIETVRPVLDEIYLQKNPVIFLFFLFFFTKSCYFFLHTFLLEFRIF